MTNDSAGEKTPRSSGGWLRPACLVFTLALLMGLPTLRGGFVGGDDHRLVLNHVLVNHPSPAHALELFKIVHRDLYQPIPLLSFSLEFAVANGLGLFDDGLDGGAWLFHFSNIVLHALNAVLVFLVLCEMSERDEDAFGRRVAVVAAILFAIHPLQVEVVAWVNGRMMLLSTFFALASLITLGKWLRAGNRRWVALTVLFVLLCAISKIRVALPLLLVISLLARRQSLSRSFIALWGVCLAVTGAFAYVNYAATAGAGMFEGAAQNLHGPRAARAVLALAWYFQHFLWPTGLASWYPTPGLVRWSDPAVLGAIAVVVVGLVGAAWFAFRSRAVALGFAWFFVAIASTVQLVPTRNALAADRYMYLPIVGLLWVVGIASVNLYNRAAKKWSPSRARLAVVPLCAALVVTLVGISWWTARFYENPIDKSLRIASLNPATPHVWERVAWALYRDGRYEEAIAHARREFDNDDMNARGSAYQVIGMSKLRLGENDEAIAALRRAIEVDPQRAAARYHLATALQELGRPGDALPLFEQAVAKAPLKNPWINRLASLYRKLGRPADARRLYEQALRNNPYEVPATLGLAELDIELATPDSLLAAKNRLDRLLRWMPENTAARVDLGVVLHALRRTREAVDEYRRVLELNPSDAAAALNLAQIYNGAGDTAAARTFFERAASAGLASVEQVTAVHGFFISQQAPERAVALWREFLSRKPESTEARVFLGWAKALAGDSSGAEAQLAPTVRDGRAPPLVRATQSYLALIDEKYDTAVAQAATLGADDARTADARRRLLRALGGVVQRRPNEPWTYCVAARLWMADGQLEPARQFLELCDQFCNEAKCSREVSALTERLHREAK